MTGVQTCALPICSSVTAVRPTALQPPFGLTESSNPLTFHLLRVSPLSLYVQSPSLTLLRFHKTPPFLPSQHLGNSLLCGQDSDRITRSSNSVSAIMQQTVTGGGAPRTMQGPQRPSACSPGPVLSPPGPRSPPPAPLLLGLHLLCPHPHLSSLEHSPVLGSKSPVLLLLTVLFLLTH